MNRTPLLLLLALGLGACATTEQHSALQRRVEAIESADAARRRLLDDSQTQVRALTEQLAQVRNQTRNLADLGARLDGIDGQLRELSGGLTDLRHTAENTTGVDQLRTQTQALTEQVTELRRRAGLLPLVDAAQLPAGAAELLQQAQAALTARDVNRARFLAGTLVQRTPQDALADDAILVIARSYTQGQAPARAAQEYQRLLRDYASADTAPVAWSELGETFVALGFCADAVSALESLVNRFGATPQGQAARARIAQVRRLPRSSCVQ